MRLVGTALEFRMKLDSDKKVVFREFYRFHKPSVRRQPRQPHTRLPRLPPEIIIEFIPVPVPFGNLFCAIGPPHDGIRGNAAWIRAQPHRASLFSPHPPVRASGR